jgi:hypothetical protein
MQSNNFKIQNPPVVGWRQVLCMTPSPRQSPKEKKFKLWLKYMYYNVHCTYIRMYISDLKKNLLQMSKTILDSTWLHYLCHQPVDLRS